MNYVQKLYYSEKNFNVLSAKQEFVIHPAALGLLPMSKASLQYSFQSNFKIEDYRLYLTSLSFDNQTTVNKGEVRMECCDQEQEFVDFPISYHGALLVGCNLVKEYYLGGTEPACFSYQTVYELVFEDGVLITTIDQSKAMLRVRKNLELGLRSLSKSRDVRCIKRFMNSAFVGDYKTFRFPHNRLKYLKEMKNANQLIANVKK